ncbi:unnamed protein product [Cladocopium goreaui]|uniref:Uncharacterized protein n=1 Tax=Cladocopium goreaui TaxID=2562237 RepID=A0A9P1C5Y7_9DINO|nr:unnamed protein product [Cladocopium goreaui]
MRKSKVLRICLAAQRLVAGCRRQVRWCHPVNPPRPLPAQMLLCHLWMSDYQSQMTLGGFGTLQLHSRLCTISDLPAKNTSHHDQELEQLEQPEAGADHVLILAVGLPLLLGYLLITIGAPGMQLDSTGADGEDDCGVASGKSARSDSGGRNFLCEWLLLHIRGCWPKPALRVGRWNSPTIGKN